MEIDQTFTDYLNDIVGPCSQYQAYDKPGSGANGSILFLHRRLHIQCVKKPQDNISSEKIRKITFTLPTTLVDGQPLDANEVDYVEAHIDGDCVQLVAILKNGDPSGKTDKTCLE